MKDYPFQVGDIVIPNLPDSDFKYLYIGEIIEINEQLKFVIHKDLDGGETWKEPMFRMNKRFRLHPDNDRLKKLKAFR